MRRRTLLAASAAAMAAGSGAFPARAANWEPRRPITMIVPYPPGGGTSVFGRALIGPLSEKLGVPVSVANKPGAGGVNGAVEAARSRPDGQTLLMTTGGALVMASLFKDIPVDPLKDFVTIAQLGALQASIIVPASSPYKTLGDLVEAAKAEPGKLRWAHTGRGVFLHIAGQSFLGANGIEATDVPFGGGAKVRAAVIGAQVAFGILGVQQNQGFENEMRALAVIAPERDPLQPDIPTVAEQGFEYEFVNTPITVFAPTGTPPEVIDTIEAYAEEIVNSEAYAEETKTAGLVPEYLPAAEARARLEELAETVRPIIEAIE